MHLPIFQDLMADKNLKSLPPAFYGLMPGPQQTAHFIFKKRGPSAL
jgi:hypothetical protein